MTEQIMEQIAGDEVVHRFRGYENTTKKPQDFRNPKAFHQELMTRVELVTSSLPRMRSTY